MIILLITIMVRIKPECVELVMEKTAVGDWFLLYLLGQNIDHIVFKVIQMVFINVNDEKLGSPPLQVSVPIIPLNDQ